MAVDMATDYDYCVVCGAPFERAQRGRPREYCSAKCRVRAHRLRQRWAHATMTYAPVTRHVTVVSCPDNLYRAGATFSWSDFRHSLSSWPEGMVVRYQTQLYTVQAGQLTTSVG